MNTLPEWVDERPPSDTPARIQVGRKEYILVESNNDDDVVDHYFYATRSFIRYHNAKGDMRTKRWIP